MRRGSFRIFHSYAVSLRRQQSSRLLSRCLPLAAPRPGRALLPGGPWAGLPPAGPAGPAGRSADHFPLDGRVRAALRALLHIGGVPAARAAPQRSQGPFLRDSDKTTQLQRAPVCTWAVMPESCRVGAELHSRPRWRSVYRVHLSSSFYRGPSRDGAAI